MKVYISGFLALFCLLAIPAQSQDYPQVTEDENNFFLEIPYAEYEDDEGETQALAVDLVAPKVASEAVFYIDFETLVEREVDTPATIDGVGACSRTTHAQFLACGLDIQDDFFEAQAKCFNSADADEQQECFAEAEAERVEAMEECDDMEEAHENLCAVFGEDPYDPDLGDITFVDLDDIAANPNPYFPLVPGNVWVYESEDETITVTVLDETREIDGIEAVVVQDIVEEDGELVEDTFDWYAQDEDGNVWYLGELSRNYEDGELSDIDGSWEHGEDGAKGGILFRSLPTVGEVYRQEYLIGEAEDIGETVSLEADESTESGYECQAACLETLEYTPLEPDVMESKFYIPGVGLILEIDLEENVRVELVDYTAAN